jgi:SEC-C motif-containing protein
MRSRYTAYALKLKEYLVETWHPVTRPVALDFEQAPRRWVALKIMRCEEQEPEVAIVEFTAFYKAGGRVREMRETSRFVREDGRWLYVDAAG